MLFGKKILKYTNFLLNFRDFPAKKIFVDKNGI